MKKIIILIFICITIISLTACNSNTKGKLSIDCSDEKTSIDLKEGNSFKCRLFNKEYEFTIKSISDTEIIVNTPSAGLVPVSEIGSISLIGKYNDFKVKKGENTRICTQTTDVQDNLILYWE